MRFARTVVRAASFTVVAALCACGQGSFGGGGAVARKDAKAETERDDGETLGDTAEGDEEADLADQAAMVSGAFLTCTEDPALPGTSTDTVAAGCTVMNGDAKLSLADLTDESWSLHDMLSNRRMTNVFTKLGGDASYHVTFEIERARMRSFLVRLDAEKGPKQRSALSAAIKPAVASGDAGGDATPGVVEVGKTEDFHLGENRYSDDADYSCHDSFQELKAIGAKMVVNFRVETRARVAITLENMCGVSRDNNKVRLVRAGQDLQNAAPGVGKRWLALEGFDAEPGDYELVVESGAYNYRDRRGNERVDLDDFVIGKIVFASDGAVTILGVATPQ